MSMTVGELQARLAKLDPGADVLTAINGAFAPVVGVASASGAAFVVLRGKGSQQESPRFSIGEEGVIGCLARLGVSDEEIAEVLGRPADSVKRKRKALGLE
jgi:hypothetical protein